MKKLRVVLLPFAAVAELALIAVAKMLAYFGLYESAFAITAWSITNLPDISWYLGLGGNKMSNSKNATFETTYTMKRIRDAIELLEMDAPHSAHIAEDIREIYRWLNELERSLEADECL